MVSTATIATLIFNFVTIYPKSTKKQIELESYLINYLLIIFTFIIGILSIIMFIKYPISIFQGERFEGVYFNSNQHGFWAFVSFILSFKYLKNKIVIVNIILEFILKILAGSRSLLISTSIFIVYLLFKKIDLTKKKNVYIFLI